LDTPVKTQTLQALPRHPTTDRQYPTTHQTLGGPLCTGNPNLGGVPTELVDATDQDEMIVSMTGDIGDQRHLAEQLLEQAKEQNIELVGPGGLLGQVTKNMLETALDAEMVEHLGYEKHDPAGRAGASARPHRPHAPAQAAIAATRSPPLAKPRGRLTTLPGVAIVRAAVFSAYTLPIERRASPEHLFSATGLAPASYQSSTITRRGRISRQGLPEHRDALMGIACGLSRNNEAFRARDAELRARGFRPIQARVALARHANQPADHAATTEHTPHADSRKYRDHRLRL
jgi:transposase